MDLNTLIKKLGDDPELAKSLKDAWKAGADPEEIAGILADAGFDAGAAEALLAEYQARRGKVIALQELDDDELDKMAGGQTILEWLDDNFCGGEFDSVCFGTYDHNYENSDVCTLAYYCDHYFHCTLNHGV